MRDWGQPYPHETMSLAEEMTALRQQMKDVQDLGHVTSVTEFPRRIGS